MSWGAATKSGLNPTAGSEPAGASSSFFNTSILPVGDPAQRPAFTAQRQQNLLYTQHSLLLSQQISPSRLERRTVWTPNLVIGIFFQEAGDARLKHFWVWRSPGFWASRLAIHILLQFQFQAKPAPLGGVQRFGSYNELLESHFSIQPVRTEPHSDTEQFKAWTPSAFQYAQGYSHDTRRWL